MKKEWKKGKNINSLEYFTNSQAQGSNDRAFSIHKQVKTSTVSSTSISFQSRQNYVLLQGVIKCPHTMSSNDIFMLKNEEVEISRVQNVINDIVNALLSLKTMQGIRQECLSTTSLCNKFVFYFLRMKQSKILTLQPYFHLYIICSDSL